MSTDAPDYPLVCLGDVLITAELSRRTLRPPDYAAENRALAALAGEMTANLETILQKLVDTALELCRADSAGISILESGEGSGVFRWHAIAGPFAPNLGSTMACDLSPCGTALNRDTVLLFDRPARHFTELAAAEPEMFESLLVPFHADGRPVGTVWAIAHSRDRKFDAEDARCLESLSRFATAAYQLATSLRAETKARGGLVQHLEQQSRILDTTLSSITDFAYVFNKEGRFVFVNQPLLDLWGLKLEEAIGKNFFDLHYPDHLAAKLRQEIQQVFDTQQGLTGETPYTSPTGAGGHYEYIFRPAFAADGTVEFVAGSTRDITERKLAEKALRESETRFRQFAENSADVLWIADAKSRQLEYLSPAYERIWGEPRDAVMRDAGCWTELLHPDYRERALTVMSRVLAGEVFTIEYRIVRPSDGEVRWIFDTGFPVPDERGQIRRFAGIAQDISERKQAEEALREADHRKDEFLATLAHELRNPLAPLRNALEILRVREGDRKGVSRVRETMEHQVDYLARLVDDLLEISRITLGKIELRKERVALKEIIEKAVEASRPLVDAADHDLDIKIPHRPLYVDADPVRLTQVIANLLNNAVKYTEGAGRIELSAAREKDEIIVRVRDTGIGITKDALAKIFDLFAQADTSSTRGQDGLGIGLTLVKRLVELHGGMVEAHSPGLGQGSEVVIRLPAFVEDSSRTESAPQAEAGTSSIRRILVVDDNVAAAETLAELLDLYGNEVQVGHDGQTALKIFDAWRPNVMLLDIGMPGMDGYEVARHVRRQVASDGIMLIALTGWGQEKDRELAREAGFDHHLLKPLDLQALRALLARAS